MGIKITFYDPDEETPERPTRKDEGRGGFTLDWVAELGWKRDPFEGDAELADFEDERQQINLFFVKHRSFGVIEAEDGLGKTSLLEWLNSELSHYKGLTAHLLRAKRVNDADGVRIELADSYRGRFKRGKPITTADLLELIEEHEHGRYVLLIDDAHLLDKKALDVVKALLELKASVLVATKKALSAAPKDELGLTLKTRSAKQYAQILSSRIEAVGGEGTRPFTKKVIERMAEDTDTTQEFLELARETAINIALKRTAVGGDIDPEDFAEDEAVKAEKTQGISSKEKAQEKKRKYDELIESLTEGMD